MEKYITCWGDSLTAMGEWVGRLSELSGLPAYNAGTGGESTHTITARQGADAIILSDVTIPAEPTPVQLADFDHPLQTYLGNAAFPLLQSGAHVNPVKIGDVEGTLAFTGARHDDKTGVWTFTRAQAGEEVVIDRPTALTTDFDRNRNAPYLMIIFMGQNGGWDMDPQKLIRQHRLMIDHARAEHVLVLGLSSGTAEGRTAYERAMKEAFGRYFISLREYLSKYGLADAGIAPTEEDLAMMAEGKTPQSLLIDSVHFKLETRIVIGNLIYKRACELGIF